MITAECDFEALSPAKLHDRIGRLMDIGWSFRASRDSDKTYRSCRVFARKLGHVGAHRNSQFQWVGATSFPEAWEYVVGEVGKIEGMADAGKIEVLADEIAVGEVEDQPIPLLHRFYNWLSNAPDEQRENQ